ncbi:MAG TPA: hypothetical protein VD768_05990 [Sphingomicrobium sp.]|nr:hypothetical protein [Sphingomicrobium sp.]
MTQRAVDVFEDRPVRTLLIVGNSRTFYNNMPAMLRALSASPESKVKIEVETVTSAGATFEKHASDGRAIRLLGRGWDDVILQGESGAQSRRETAEYFVRYGPRLAQAAAVREGRPTLLVNWPYDRSIFEGYGEYDRGEHLAFLHEVHARVASEGKLDRINLGALWESLRLANPDVALTTDGNHPSVAGSYLYALVVYKHVTGADVTPLKYAPDELDPAVAASFREAVDAFPVTI